MSATTTRPPRDPAAMLRALDAREREAHRLIARGRALLADVAEAREAFARAARAELARRRRAQGTR